MSEQHQTKHHIWRILFIILCIVNVVTVVSIFIYLYSPIPNEDIHLSNKEYTKEHSSEFVIRTTKHNLNDLINAYLDKMLENTKYQYSVKLEEDVQLFGEIPIFSAKIPLLIHFDPIVKKNGDIALKQKSISVGFLELPNQKIMQYVAKYLVMPEWVVVNPKEEEIYVKITEMDIKSNFRVEFEQFNLETNDIAIRLFVPYHTLGIDVVPNLDQIEEE